MKEKKEKKTEKTAPAAAADPTVTDAAAAAIVEAAAATDKTPAIGEAPVDDETPVGDETPVDDESGATPVGEATEASEPNDKSEPSEAGGERALLADFLAALTPTERQTLVAVLSHLSQAEREREAARARAEEDAILSEMEGEPVFRGIGARADALRALAGAVDWLGALPVRERLAAAFYIDRGMRYGEPTREDLLHAVLSDEALLRELSLRRREASELQKKTLPPVHAKRGATGAPAAVKREPKTLAEATSEAKKFLRFYQR